MSTFTITLRSKDGADSIRTPRAALKVLLRRFGLKAIEEEKQHYVTPIFFKKAPKRGPPQIRKGEWE
jgi:hypothetical protein